MTGSQILCNRILKGKRALNPFLLGLLCFGWFDNNLHNKHNLQTSIDEVRWKFLFILDVKINQLK